MFNRMWQEGKKLYCCYMNGGYNLFQAMKQLSERWP